MQTVCIIPARGGSKRIPRKNIKPFCGQPIITYSIEAALGSGCFDDVVVSTEDDEIAAISEQAGAQVMLRPQNLADDYVSVGESVMFTLRTLAGQGKDYGFFCMLFATAPFVRPSNLRNALEMLKDNPGKNSCLSVTEFPFPIQRAIRVNPDDHSLGMFQPEHYASRSQDLEKAYHDAGQFCWYRNVPIDEGHHPWGEQAMAFKISPYEVQDIDTEEDWIRAEAMFRALQEMGKRE